jgi:hypothetical protein
MNKLSSFIILGILSSLILWSSSIVYAQEDANITNSGDPMKFFAIQHAQYGSISENNSTAYSLELNDVSDKTILFSDRPDRIVTSISTADFIGNWSVGEDSFSMDVPNTALIVNEQEGQEITIVELYNPIYDVDSKTLKYEITPDNGTSIDLPNEFGQSTLVIDNHCSPLDPRC